MIDLGHPLVAVAATAILGVIGWLIRDVIKGLRDDIHDLARELVRHMGNEEELRKADKEDRERRQEQTDRQFAAVRDDIRKVHARIDQVLIRQDHPSNGDRR